MGVKCSSLCQQNNNDATRGSSILDRVISQASAEDQCLLYKLANYKKGGELIDAYNLGGQAEVEKLIREQFGQFTYRNGAGQVINRSEYLRWKFRDHDQVVLPIEASLSRHDPLSNWLDHEACWQMQFRGSLGETLLHVLIICDTKIHTRLARTLLKCFPRLAVDVVEGEEYLGASSLHLAIAYDNNELVQDLVDSGANVNQRAVGSFFLPRDQQRPKPAKHTDYEGLAYLGEYPLAWAACCANESVYNLLLESDAHPDLQDNFGNMILHMVVVCDKLDMFSYALRHPRLPASNGIANNDGLTPLTLACKLGRAEVFREMLELSAKEFWRYSNITCSAYALNALDTLLPDGSTNWNSALFIILNGTKEEHLDMLDGGIIQRLLEEKWKTFARKQFLKRLLILLLHLLLLSSAVYLRPKDPDEPLLGWSDDLRVITRYVCEVGTVMGVLSYLILQQGDEIKNQGLWTFLKQQSHSPPKAIFLVSNLLILACIPCRFRGDRTTEEAILVFAVPGSWFLLMFFAGAVRLTGPFVTMIYSMITGDMLTFGMIYTIVLFGFSQSFYYLYKGFPNVKNSLYNTYPTTWMALFQITMGNYDYQELMHTSHPSVSKTVFVLFMVFVPILLLNMLIAMMGNTYAHVIEQSEKEWMKQWAKIVVTLERAIPQADAHHYLQEYSISLGPSEDPGTEQRGVMVIKSKSKTRAKQRKGAVANWKRVGKVTCNALRKKGLTGEEMRCLMWGRESINTPIKKKKTTTKTDQAGQQFGTNGAFADALTSALDVMAFTQDFDISTATQNLSTQAVNATIANGTLGDRATPAGTTPDVAQLLQAPPPKYSDATTCDPLRELVLCSKNYDCEPERLNDLATQAANLHRAEEAAAPGMPKPGFQMLAGIFADTEETIKSIGSRMKKASYSALDTSDCDEFLDPPMLGKMSRARRAESASRRSGSGRSLASDRRKLCESSTSSESLTGGAAGDSADERIKQVKEAANTTNDRQSRNEMESSTTEGKKSRTKVSKTAKANRVAPQVEVKKRCHSANEKPLPSETEPGSPDPLEPWSTQSIASMNTILAWNNGPESF